jgi:hypothetical protein
MTAPLFTPAQFKAMAALSRKQQPKNAHRNTIRSLILNGWVDHARGGWLQLTDTGRAALTDYLDRPLLLAVQSDALYTDNPDAGMRGEQEAIDPEAQTRMSAQAKMLKAQRIVRDTATIRQRIADNITELEQAGDLSRTAVKRLANMRRELARLEKDIAA